MRNVLGSSSRYEDSCGHEEESKHECENSWANSISAERSVKHFRPSPHKASAGVPNSENPSQDKCAYETREHDRYRLPQLKS
ncbi:MAG: hypothetical protein ACJAY5_001438 [Actinomycetes bacterium]|jgi:hypothetical protein